MALIISGLFGAWLYSAWHTVAMIMSHCQERLECKMGMTDAVVRRATMSVWDF